MIVLDTNVLSELMKPEEWRSKAVMAWLRSLDVTTAFHLDTRAGRAQAGVEALTDGARRRAIDAAIERILVRFEGRMLPFGTDAAWAYGTIVSQRRRPGRPTNDAFDLQIAAIARFAGMAVATRNVTDFQECGVEVVDPWTASRP